MSKTNDLSQYLAARDHILPGDVIMFSGREPISRLIQFFTASPLSHAAIVRQSMHHGVDDVIITESTRSAKRDGAQSNPLGLTLEYYGSGARADCLCLAPDFRALIDWQKFYRFIGDAETNVTYDVEGLFGFLLRDLPILGNVICQSEDPHQMFCDAYVIAIFEAAGALRGINERKMSPQDLAEMRIYERKIPLLGPGLKIRNFNTV